MLINMSFKKLIDETASSSPAPGGGSISALAGAQAAALICMYCSLTIGKKKYSSVEKLMQQTHLEASRFKEELLELVDEDANSFKAVMAAFNMPQDTEEAKEKRKAAIQESLQTAAEVPLKVSKRCLQLLQLARELCGQGNQNALTDLAVANLQAYAGLKGAAYNVLINLGTIKDEEFTRRLRHELENICQQGERLYRETLKEVEEELKACFS